MSSASSAGLRPSVTLHFAQSLDGRIGFGPERERTLLSSDEGVSFAHRARREHDAVLVGIGTALHDDPQLTARDGGARQPRRVVLDSALRLPCAARLFGAAASGVILFGVDGRAGVARQRELEGVGATVRTVPADEHGQVSLPHVLSALRELGVARLLVEGGARVVTSFLRQRLVDRAQIEIAPYLLGEPSTPALHELGSQNMVQALRLEGMEVERLGRSILVRGDVAYPIKGES